MDGMSMNDERDGIRAAWMAVQGFTEIDLASRPEILRLCERYCNRVMAERKAERMERNP